jgi:hypothetical protein
MEGSCCSRSSVILADAWSSRIPEDQRQCSPFRGASRDTRVPRVRTRGHRIRCLPRKVRGRPRFLLAQAHFLSPSVLPDHRYSAQVSLWYSLPNSLCRKGLRCFFRWVRSPAVKLERASDYFQIVFKSCRDVVDEPRGDRFMGLAEGREFEGPCLEPVFAASEGRGVFPW